MQWIREVEKNLKILLKDFQLLPVPHPPTPHLLIFLLKRFLLFLMNFFYVLLGDIFPLYPNYNQYTILF